MVSLDLIVIVLYTAGIVLFGTIVSRRHRDVRDYFVGGHHVPWWAIAGSIVATETSTITFVSVPGFAFSGNWTFLQLALGMFAGRVIVAALFVPAYLRGRLLTVYQLLGERFGAGTRCLASALFLTTRSLADGVRLFATGLVVAELLRGVPGAEATIAAWIPLASSNISLLLVSTVVVGVATMLYTYFGGMLAVIWTDVVQFVVYVAGALAAVVVLVSHLPDGWSSVVAAAAPADKFRVFDFTVDVTRGYTFWSGVIGGAFLTIATHGTDQLVVQRYLCCRSVREARTALLTSGVVVFLQFALFLLIGSMLFAYYQTSPGAILAIAPDGRVPADRVFPAFIATAMPAGLRGLVIAAIFAAAMSTLSSSLNSSAAAAIADFYMPATGASRTDDHYLLVARGLTAVWGVVQVGVAIGAIWVSTRVIDETLGIASFTNGVVLGLFLLGTFTGVGQTAAIAGVVVGAATMLVVKLATPVNWQWYVLIGAGVTCVAGMATERLRSIRHPAH
jgi:SSS family solute:Na+ symporter